MNALLVDIISSAWVWFGLFFAALSALLVCVAKIRQYKNIEAQQLNKIPIETSVNDTVITFLIEQFHKTKRLDDGVYFRHDELDRHACSLRSAYLKIEEKSLKNNTEPRGYHLSINKGLVKLLRIIKEDAKKSLDNEGVTQQSLMYALDTSAMSSAHKNSLQAKIEEFCTQLKSGALDERYKKNKCNQLLKMIKNIDNMEERVAMKKLLLLAESASSNYIHYSTLSDSVSGAKRDLTALEDALEAPGVALSAEVQSKLDALNRENTKLYSQVQMLRQWSKDNKNLAYPETIGMSAVSVHDFSEEIIEKHEEELRALKVMVRTQKGTIFELESEIDNYRKSEHSKELQKSYGIDFSALNHRLNATEELIGEQELNVGRVKAGLAQLSSTNTQGEESDALKGCIDQLRKEIEETKNAYATKNVEFDYISELISVGSLEDLSLLVFQYFSDQKCDPFLLISHKGRSIELSSTGSLSVKDKTIINSMMPNDASKDEEHYQLQFRYQNIGGILRFLPDGSDQLASCEAMLKIAKITDAFIEKIANAQSLRNYKKQLEQCSNGTKQLAQTVDGSFDQLCQTHKQLISNHIVRAQNLLRVKNATAAQIACLKQVEIDMLDDMVSNGAIRIKTRKEFLELVKKMDI